jgi:fatty acid elongase 3
MRTLEHFIKAVFGYDLAANPFQFKEAPLSSVQAVIISVAIYLIVIYGLRELLQRTGTRKVTSRAYVIFHNYALSFGSGLVLVVLMDRLIPRIYANGLFWAICSPEVFDDTILNFLYYINYLLKYVELIDTLILVLEQKKLIFLHVYHHTLTLILCWTQLEGETSVQWIPITINLYVHVVMYYYYALAARGIRVWWKQWVTTIQIIQFVIDVGFVWFCTFTRSAFDGYMPQIFNFGSCHGTYEAAIFGSLLLTSYLWLFIEFFRKVYSTTEKKKVQ